MSEQATNIRDRIVEVLAKYNRTLEDAPLDALTMAMERMIDNRSLLRPASSPPPLPTDPVERAKVTKQNADWYRNTFKPFA